MQPLTLREIAGMAEGRLRGRGPDVLALSLDTDSRTADPGDLFVALKGPRFDGHDHALRAIAGGATACLVEAGRIPKDVPGAWIEVDDTLKALGRLAAAYRRRFQARVVGITGSNGKTTTKEMLAAICAAAGPTVKSEKSFNNAIGLPVTLLHLNPATEYAVLEMGANAPGEIAALAEIARPDVAVVTNVGRAHLAGFGGLEGVARAKGELVEAVARRGGTVVLNADDPHSAPLFDRARGARIVPFSLQQAGKNYLEMRGETSRSAFQYKGERGLAVALPVLGIHNVENAMAALAAAEALDIGLEKAVQALDHFVPPPMRCEQQRVGGVLLVNDTYNANPDSLIAALAWLHEEEGRRVACLGEMLELGDASEPLHQEAGAQAAKAGVALLVGVGPAGKWIVQGYREAGGAQALCLADAVAAGEELAKLLRPGDVVLFKASRGAALERAADACTKALS